MDHRLPISRLDRQQRKLRRSIRARGVGRNLGLMRLIPVSTVCRVDSARRQCVARSPFSPVVSNAQGGSIRTRAWKSCIEQQCWPLLVPNTEEQYRLVQEYRTFCGAQSFDPRNPSLCSVGAFIVVRTKRLKGSTATISNVLGAIRRQCTLDKVSYLEPDEQLLLADLVKELEYNDAKGNTSSPSLVEAYVGCNVSQGDYAASGGSGRRSS